MAPADDCGRRSARIIRAMNLRIACLMVCCAGLALGGEALDLGGGVRLDLTPVAAGAAPRGRPADEGGRSADEPLRSVRISRDFLIGTTLVTRGQFARF